MQPEVIVVELIRAARKAYARKWRFFALFLLALFVSFSALLSLDLVPNSAEPVTARADDAGAVSAPNIVLSASPLVAAADATSVVAPANESSAGVIVPQGGELPISMTIPAIHLTATIANPEATNVGILDGALLHGAVRYPTSAPLGEDGNVILFGHSSYLPIVHNQAYKTFDGIQNLKVGDTVTVYSADTSYVYAVREVSKESANDGAIPLSVAGRELTLATCDSFGAKSDRFVVVADFVGSHPNGA